MVYKPLSIEFFGDIFMSLMILVEKREYLWKRLIKRLIFKKYRMNIRLKTM
ncbi:hypothetical protein EV194_1302 [Natronoflexus pectinivorans]|uniref:Uncharacterized protein n=1 Tax=Natronoflexus pectinivorans TaxID=682526 RepID=A0A4R2G2F9_9BACT|nr:hypothetical protein EV194_1302 [Natronoflexus pectinivorans]